ncbi:E3 ubiquitin-protein ligase MARCHF9-like isoform X2 [Amphibalanus amphitrite]|nr:E3 ubiquitin-protein ligase MARCHF9-like isoform X2 [Amphibalanus amphitrite]
MNTDSNGDITIDDFPGKWPDGITLQVLESELADRAEDGPSDEGATDSQQTPRTAGQDRQEGADTQRQSGRQGSKRTREDDNGRGGKRTREEDSGQGSPTGSRQLSQHSGKRSRDGDPPRSRDSDPSRSRDSDPSRSRGPEPAMTVRVDPAPAASCDPTADQGRPAGEAPSRGGSVTCSEWGEFCRICHESGEKLPLVTACRCTGSMQHVHNECLIRWILSSFNTHCEICLHRYRIGTTGMRMPHLWKLPVTDGVERYHMLLCVVALVVLAGVISFLIYVSTDEGREARTYRNSPLAPALYAVYAVLGLVCLGLATAELHYTVCPLIERFRLTNMNLLVVPYDPEQGSLDSLDRISAEFVTV